MRGRLKLTRFGVVLLVLFIAAAAMAMIGSATVQIIGFVGVVFLALFALDGAPLGRSAGAAQSTLETRARAAPESQVLEEAQADASAWQRERERRERAPAVAPPPPTGDDPFSGRG